MDRLPSRLVAWWQSNRALGATVVALGVVGCLIAAGLVLMTGDGGTSRLGQVASATTPSSPPSEASGDDVTDDPTDDPTPDRPRKPAESDSTVTTSRTGDSGGTGGGGGGSADAPDEPVTQHVEFDVSADTSGGEYPETTISVRVHGAIGGNMWALFLDPQEGETWTPTLSPDEDLPKCINDDTLRPYDRTFTFHHHYRAAGEYRIALQSYLGVCRDDGGPRWTGTISVSKGSTRSNGPAQPKLQVEWQDQQGDSRILVYASDVDGDITTATIRWDNGTTATQTFEGCDDVADRRGWLDGEQYIDFPIEPGASSAEVTVTSTGCDGKDAQTVSTTVDESDRPEY